MTPSIATTTSQLATQTDWSGLLAGGTIVWFLNRIVDMIFLADLVVNFFLMYQKEFKDGTTMWIYDRKMIIKHYLKGYFIIDTMSTVPFDMLAGIHLAHSVF